VRTKSWLEIDGRFAIGPHGFELRLRHSAASLVGTRGRRGGLVVSPREEYAGHVRVLGKEVRTWAPDDYERIGVSLETPNHFLKLTGTENLHYFAALYGLR
jgi:hypothetical protein